MRRLLLLLLVCAGCTGDTTDGYLIVDERFEDEAALAVGWSVVGTIDLVPTIHPAEHGLVTDGPASLTRFINFLVYSDFQDGEWLEYSTNCPGAPEVWLESESFLMYRVVASIPEKDEPQDEFERIYASIPPLPVEQGAVTLFSLTLLFEEDAPGCVIDNVRFYQPYVESGY